MATSESDDFESADEELDNRSASRKKISSQRSRAVVDSESDDDTAFAANSIQPTYRNARALAIEKRRKAASPNSHQEDNTSIVNNDESHEPATDTSDKKYRVISEAGKKQLTLETELPIDSISTTNKNKSPQVLEPPAAAEASTTVGGDTGIDKPVAAEPVVKPRKDRQQRQQKQREAKSLGGKKLGSKISSEAGKVEPVVAAEPEGPKNEDILDAKEPDLTTQCWGELDDILSKSKSRNAPKWDSAWDNPQRPDDVAECWEGMDEDIEIPEELKSDKKFKEVFKSDGWEDVDGDTNVAEAMTEEKIQPVLDKLSSIGKEQEKNEGWGWGGWGVSSLINTASAGVTSLTNHVSQGLTMLEESIGAPDPEELAKIDKTEGNERSQVEKEVPDMPSQTSFGFGNLMSGVSSITKLVESTSNKVIAGGLDTLETIGKKTMEVLQDGDPGLKKKRAFFTNEKDKPILSQMLREAKDKADMEEKTLEEKQLARKVHFESLFDDYQGLVHLEALEMLSKQCDMKIQQHMINLNADELCSIQETLEEVKELCDLGDEDEEETPDTDLEERLKGACKDLGVVMTYDKLLETWQQTRSYLSTVSTTNPLPTDREIFQRAISIIAQFTAFSVERFHKTAELLLVKERRSTVNEADALVQLTNILSCQVGVMANLFSDKLNERLKQSEKTESINANITTIFLEAANASSYIQDAFKLLIPVLQVGAT